MLTHIENPLDLINNFAKEVKQGLLERPKCLPSKYLYNKKGGGLFQQITTLPEYYLTKCEYQVFDNNKASLLDIFYEKKQKFRLIELGPGNARKTQVLLKYFTQKEVDFMYLPIDISDQALKGLGDTLDLQFPKLHYETVQGDYFSALAHLQKQPEDGVRNIVLFLGSNIGNFPNQAEDFLQALCAHLNADDLLLIGFDLKKRPEVIYNAYHDSKGVTDAFHLNLLDRINRELEGEFHLNRFRYYPSYDPQTGELWSYLVSQKEQLVSIKGLEMELDFKKWEAIRTEVAKKYDLSEIETLRTKIACQLVDYFYDPKDYFVDALWKVQ